MKRLLFIFLLCVSCVAQAAITDLKVSTAQVFDVQWNMSGATLNVSNMSRPFISVPNGRQMTVAEVNTMTASNQYFGFFNSTTNPGTYGMAIYNSDGTLNRVVHNTGSFSKFGNGVIFYQGNNQWGTIISTAQGYSYGQSASFTQTYTPTPTQLSTYTPPSSTPLTAGQQAPVAPVYTSNITTAQQLRYNSSQARVNSIMNNSVYIEQVGDSNTINITQDSRYNSVAGTASTAAPVQGNYNTITIRQGEVGTSYGKNLVEMTVYGNFNNLNLNQGRDTYGGYTGMDQGGHYQSVYVNGSNNNIVTQQQNTTGASGHYLETNINGSNNLQNFTQTGNATKQIFSTTTGSNNILGAYQDGLGNHYLDVNMYGDGNSATVSQTGNTRNAATINITNAGGPGSVNLTQTGGQIYNITTICATTGGCAPVTLRQGN